jgi:membrane-bound metal-dependent hydrolase YbcI (DUF457 family)
MDTLSHAAWGWVALRQGQRRLAWWGALAGAAPDLLFFVPYAVEQVATNGFGSLFLAREPAMWTLDGPPLPPILAAAYDRYYVYSHSLVLLAAVLILVWALGARRWLWLGIPYALHILMDIPTHEKFAVQPFFPLSDWRFIGLSWGDPRIFWPHLVLLLAVLAWTWRRSRRREG